MASDRNLARERSGSVDSFIGTPEEVCLKRVRLLTNAILELVPVKSETLKVEDREKLRDMVCEINQLFGEQNGILREVRSAAEKRGTAEPTRAPANPRQTYADRRCGLARSKPASTPRSSWRKKWMWSPIKSGYGVSKRGEMVLYSLNAAQRRTLKTCDLGRREDAGREAEKVAELIRQQNESIESVYETGEKLKEDFRVFRFYATPQDGKRTVKNAVYSVSPRLRSLLLVGHKAKECKGELTCKKCVGPHERKDCKAAQPKCAVCQRSRIPGLDIKHEAYAKTCPARKRLLEEERSEDFQNLGAKIDYENHTLELNKVKIPFYFELNPSTFKPFSQKASKYIKVSVNIEEGQVPESIAFAKDGYCQLPCEEEREVNINFHHPLDVELVVNYEFQAPRPEAPRMNISNLVRTEHINPEEKRELLTLCTKYKDVFFYEHSDLRFTNVVKHKIRLRMTQYSVNPPDIHIT
ncbi:hypothetical protein Trydic_g4858 [Trypoxylus dichotomus]